MAISTIISIHGEIYNDENICRSKEEEREASYEVDERCRKCNWTFNKRLIAVSDRQEKVPVFSEQYSQDEKMDQCLIQEEGNGKSLLITKSEDLIISFEIPPADHLTTKIHLISSRRQQEIKIHNGWSWVDSEKDGL